MSKFSFLAIASKSDEALRLIEPLEAHDGKPEDYKPVEGLREAMDAAMLLRIPLLLTGEPGTGKTSAAPWLAKELSLPAPRRMDVKSTTTGRDLFYSFDEIARFRDVHDQGARRPLIDYLQLSPLGEAIVRAAGGKSELERIVADSPDEIATRAFGSKGALTAARLLPSDKDFAAAPSRYSVVLIDEFDKAPRDTPNDLLAEMESMSFAIPELGVKVQAERQFRPILIITSNSEKTFPEPFLRRCVYFDIPFTREQLERVAKSRLKGLVGPSQPLFVSALNFLTGLRERPGLTKKPGTAEFLMWVQILIRQVGVDPNKSLADWVVASGEKSANLARLKQSLVCLAKTMDDRKHAEVHLSESIAA